MSLRIVYPEIPPTSNKIYIRGTILTTVAREYAERFAHFMAVHHLPEVSALNPSGLYCLSLHFYLPCLNETYNNPNVKPSKRAKTRYKRLDLSNRIKLLEDCVRDALAIDDSQTFEANQMKFHAVENQHVEIYINEVDPAWHGIPPEVRMAS